MVFASVSSERTMSESKLNCCTVQFGSLKMRNRNWPRPVACADAVHPVSVHPNSLPGASRALNGRAHAGVLAADLAACNGWQPAIDEVRALKTPTLVVVGRRDQMTPQKAGRALAAEIPGAKLVTLDAGHSMMSERPRELLDALKDFLGSR